MTVTSGASRFEALGFGIDAFEINVFDLPSGEAGLLGLNFLDRFNYEVRSIEGRILVERAA